MTTAFDALGVSARSLFAALQHADDSDAGPAPGGSTLELTGEAGREALGTRVRWRLWPPHGQPGRARYRAYGCPHTLAACEWVARRLESATPLAASREQWLAQAGTPAEWAQALQVPAAKLGRLLVIEDALRCALVPDRVVTNPE